MVNCSLDIDRLVNKLSSLHGRHEGLPLQLLDDLPNYASQDMQLRKVCSRDYFLVILAIKKGFIDEVVELHGFLHVSTGIHELLVKIPEHTKSESFCLPLPWAGSCSVWARVLACGTLLAT